MTPWTDERITRSLQARNPVDDGRFDGVAFTEEGRALLASLLAAPAGRARPTRHRATGRPRVRAALAAGAAAVVTTTTLLASGVLLGASSGTPSAAAAVLEQAGRGAATGASTPTVGPGQWAYTETVGTRRVDDYGHPRDPIDLVYRHVTTQQWVAPDGRQRQVVTYGGPPAFATPASHRNWVTIGSPSTVLATPADAVTTVARAPLLHVASLPRDPAHLLRAVEDGATRAVDRKTEGVDTHGTRFTTFVDCVALLTRPVIGATPRFRSSVLDAMAKIPGVQLLGHGTDALGRPGKLIGAPPAPTGLRQELLLDPTTGKVLSSRQVVTVGTRRAAARGLSVGQVVAQTTYVASGIATSSTSVPPAVAGGQQGG